MLVIDPFKVSEIVNKTNFETVAAKLDMEVGDKMNVSSLSIDVIPVSLQGLQELRFTTAAPGTKVPSHSHTGPLVRVVTEGELTLEDQTYGRGDWMVIPANHAYSIDSPSGYAAMWVCIACWRNA